MNSLELFDPENRATDMGYYQWSEKEKLSLRFSP